MNASKQTRDLTQGRPLTQILLFALPLVAGTLFQQLYSFVDTVMVGRFVGVDALAAVGDTYSLNFLTLGFIQGAYVGFGIPLSQSWGAGEPEELRRYYWNGWYLSAVVAVVMTVLTTLFAGPLLHLVQTPEDIFQEALAYVRIIFLGLPVTILYNYGANTLRSVGDSRHPLYFLLISSGVNILLDYLFMAPLQMGVRGAALATVLSQAFSGALCLWWLHGKTDVVASRPGERQFSGRHVKRMCVVGLPMGFEYAVSALGAVVLQGAINSLGTTAIAAQTTGEKIRQMFTLPMESVGMAMATYVGQNFGAKRIDRIRQGIRSGLLIQAVYCVLAWLVLFVGKRPFVALVLGDSTSAAAQGALQYLTLISPLFLLLGMLMIFRNTLQGMGYSSYALLSGVAELIGRSVGSAIAVTLTSFAVISVTNPMAWGLAMCYCAGMVAHFLRKHERLLREENGHEQ
ncbi:MAG: MATE family efflux transporter [Clostridiales bacterium]|nr:MATE family efflux transporter [Clostridiales bacterium]